MKKVILLLPLLLSAMIANGEPIVRVVSTNGSGSSVATDKVHKLVLSSTAVDVVNTEGSVLLSVPLAEIARVEFKEGKPDTPTATGQIQETNEQCTKFLRDGQLYILHKGTMYNVQGQVIINAN